MGTDMNKFDRFCEKHRRFGLKNLMLIIAAGNLLLFFMSLTDRGGIILSYFTFNRTLILQGQVWRLISYIFIPQDNNILFLVLWIYFYYWIGKTLENEWGTLKFNIYYLSGIILNDIFCLLMNTGASATFLNLSLFFAYATMFPDNTILLFFIIPIKIKYIAIVEAVYFAIMIVLGNFPGNLLPVVAMLNYIIYFAGYFRYYLQNRRRYTARSIDFKKKVKDIKRDKGYLHRCAVCGKTDTDYPEIEFRYCSLCKNYACYCEEHIMDHTHM